MANTKFTRAVKKAKALYKTGRYKKFSDAVKAAYKKIGSTSTSTKANTTGNRTKTGTKTITAHVKVGAAKRRKTKSPGIRRSATLTGVSAASLTSELKNRLKDTLGKQLVRRETATTKRDKKKVQKLVLATKLKLRRLQ